MDYRIAKITSLNIRAMALAAKIEGMKASNSLCAVKNMIPCYVAHDFNNIASQLKLLGRSTAKIAEELEQEALDRAKRVAERVTEWAAGQEANGASGKSGITGCDELAALISFYEWEVEKCRQQDRLTINGHVESTDVELPGAGAEMVSMNTSIKDKVVFSDEISCSIASSQKKNDVESN